MTLTEFFNADLSLPREDMFIICKGIETCLNSVDYYSRQGKSLALYYIMNPSGPYNASYTNDRGKVVGYLNVPEDKMLTLTTQVRDALAEKHFWQKQVVCINLRTMQVVKD